MSVAGIAGKRRSEIPDKLFFRIGEVREIVGVEAHVLRYWESEFPTLAPRKTSSGQRQYRRKDVETALAIKELLYGKRFTIEGARKALRSEGKAAVLAPEPVAVPRRQLDALREIRVELERILELLGS